MRDNELKYMTMSQFSFTPSQEVLAPDVRQNSNDTEHFNRKGLKRKKQNPSTSVGDLISHIEYICKLCK